MNTYHLRILDGVSTKGFLVKIEAETLSWSEAGLYQFSITKNGDPTGEISKVAYYPVSRTIIEKVEHSTPIKIKATASKTK
jgi:hypothetical protein